MHRSLAAFLLSPVAALAAVAPVHAETPRWGAAVLRQPAVWYASPEALALARSVAAHQSPEGGWPKNFDLSRPPPPLAPEGSRNTFDNEGTILPLELLARVTTAQGDAALRASFLRGLDYTLAAQQPSGGWPQFYPLRGGYYDHITFNDDAMIRVMTLLQAVAAGAPPYAFVDAPRRARAAEAVRRGVDVILRTQVRRDGVLTGWSAQHDQRSLQPAWARRFEPPSLSGAESVGIVRFLMSLPHPSAEVVAAVEGAAAWLERSAIRDTALESFTDAQGRLDRRLVAAPGRRLWARFYDLQTGAPVYVGRDSVPHARLDQIEHERRNGYNYVGTWAETLLTRELPAWRARIGRAERS